MTYREQIKKLMRDEGFDETKIDDFVSFVLSNGITDDFLDKESSPNSTLPERMSKIIDKVRKIQRNN